MHMHNGEQWHNYGNGLCGKAGQRRAVIVNGKAENVRVLEVVCNHPLRHVVQRLCRVESTGRLVLVSDTEFGALMADTEKPLAILPGT
ncbi:MAG TPA: hypothetical protein VND64_27460 [Pirellulales bacterium]|nr:hypothetical protein [Pirellulales bacterium]